MMGGDVTVTSEPGKGSVFTVRLPAGEDTQSYPPTQCSQSWYPPPDSPESDH